MASEGLVISLLLIGAILTTVSSSYLLQPKATFNLGTEGLIAVHVRAWFLWERLLQLVGLASGLFCLIAGMYILLSLPRR